MLLIVVAAGLLAGAFRALHEAGVWNIGQTIVFDSSHILHNDSVMGVLMGGFFGYTDHPVVSDLVLYVVYLVTVLYLFFRQQKAA